LAKRDVLLKDGAYAKVHEFMDRGVGAYGASHRGKDVFHQEVGLRSWLNSRINVIGQDRATDWLRAGLGHICLDEAESGLDRRYSMASVFDSAYRSMAQRRWTNVRFRVRRPQPD